VSGARTDQGRRRIGAAPLDLDDLQRRLSAAAAQAGLEDVDALERVQGGGSGITLRAQAARDGAHEPIVVKVAPPGLPPTLHRDVLRQARVLTALEAVPGVRAPRVLFTDQGQPPEIPPLFAMSWESGESVEPIFSHGELGSPNVVAGRLRSAAQVLGALHSVRPEDVRLADEAPVSLTAELDRWTAAFATVDDRLRGSADEAAELLLGAIPEEVPATLVHGDYRLGNMLCHDDTVVAVIDWELWGISDPRLDLGWFLLHHDAAGNPHQDRSVPAMPAMSELVAEYERAAGRRVERLWWFEAMARYKQAAAGALLLKRSPLPADDPAVVEGARRLRAEIDDAILIVTAGVGPAARPS
jgi:aminoglycoside phosphotransferase (APT) family kinase protein